VLAIPSPIEGASAVGQADGGVAGAYLFFETYGTIQMHLGGPSVPRT
jgi:hypothetical protein